MKTNVRKNGDTLIVSMSGRLSFETQDRIRDDLLQLIGKQKTDSVAKRVIFDFKGLEFVGSSGISSFVHTLRQVHSTLSERPRYCHVGSEFRKIMKAFDDSNGFEFFETQEKAIRSFDDVAEDSPIVPEPSA